MQAILKSPHVTSISGVILTICIALLLVVGAYVLMSQMANESAQDDLLADLEDKEKTNNVFTVVGITAAVLGVVALTILVLGGDDSEEMWGAEKGKLEHFDELLEPKSDQWRYLSCRDIEGALQCQFIKLNDKNEYTAETLQALLAETAEKDKFKVSALCRKKNTFWLMFSENDLPDPIVELKDAPDCTLEMIKRRVPSWKSASERKADGDNKETVDVGAGSEKIKGVVAASTGGGDGGAPDGAPASEDGNYEFDLFR